MTNAIHEARALLRLFESSAVKELYVRVPNFELFLAGSDGSFNPMREAPVMAQSDAREGWTLVAPHIGTLNSTLPAGAPVQVGTIVAKFSLLDEVIDLAAECAGVIEAVFAADGDMLEFEHPVLRII